MDRIRNTTTYLLLAVGWSLIAMATKPAIGVASAETADGYQIVLREWQNEQWFYLQAEPAEMAEIDIVEWFCGLRLLVRGRTPPFRVASARIVDCPQLTAKTTRRDGALVQSQIDTAVRQPHFFARVIHRHLQVDVDGKSAKKLRKKTGPAAAEGWHVEGREGALKVLSVKPCYQETNVLLAVDQSGSLRTNWQRVVDLTARIGSNWLKQGLIHFATISADLGWRDGAFQDNKPWRQHIDALPPGLGASHIGEGLSTLFWGLVESKKKFDCLILITDGQANDPDVDWPALIDAVDQSELPILLVLVKRPLQNWELRLGRSYKVNESLIDLAAGSGGMVIEWVTGESQKAVQDSLSNWRQNRFCLELEGQWQDEIDTLEVSLWGQQVKVVKTRRASAASGGGNDELG